MSDFPPARGRRGEGRSQGHEPIRTCVACRAPAGKRDLIRLVRAEDGSVMVDAARRAPGRGAYLHADPACYQLARKRRALERALKAAVSESVWSRLEAAAPGVHPGAHG